MRSQGLFDVRPLFDALTQVFAKSKLTRPVCAVMSLRVHPRYASSPLVRK